jgi:hypothetical protein
VQYDEETEKRDEFDRKQKRLLVAEEAKQIEDTADASSNGGGDTFVQRLLATIIKNLEVTITKVHIR